MLTIIETFKRWIGSGSDQSLRAGEKKMADERYNRKNPAVKRILQEVKEMQANPSDDFMSLPLEVL